MQIVLFFAYILVVIFFLGLAGSAVVVVICFAEDLMILLGFREKKESHDKP